MSNHEMSMSIKAKTDIANKGIQETIKGMKELGREIISVQTKLKPNGNTSYVVQYKNALDRVTETYKRLEDGTVKLAKSTSTSLKRGFDAGRLLWYYNILRGVLNRFKGIEQSAIDFNETIEKFNVSMGTSVTQATKFQNIISETFGTSRADMMNYQSNFRNVMAGLGDISSKTAEKISESLTKMSLDYSSLFNVSQDAAANKIQAALVGQIMPVRRESGYDVSKNAVNQRAMELGIDRTYAQLTETEKRLIRIMLLMDQMKNTGAFEDLARTVESPSNQIKILKNQLQELGIWLGNVFMGTIGAILPYINGFVMALKELIKMFAIFVGYKPIAAGEGEALQVAEQAAGGVSDNLGSAAGKAKELKKQLQGFDELNIINTPKDTKDKSNKAPIGIDPAILGALSEYDSLMDGVRMKATEIRDKIMDWLGFVKQINPLTGEISWDMKDGYTNFEKILDVVKQIGAGILAWKVSNKVLSFIQKLGFLESVNTGRFALGLGITITGIFAEYNGIKHMLDGDIDMFTLLETLLGGAAITTGVVAMLKATKLGQVLYRGEMFKIGIGVALAIGSFTVLLDGIEKGDIMKQILGTLGLAGVGAMIGSVFGATGIGIVLGLTVSVATEMFANAKNQTSELTEAILKNRDALDEQKESTKKLEEEVQNKINNGTAELNSIQRITEELEYLVDANGKVKAGYEDRVQFILTKLNDAFGTEYELIDGVISKNGEQIKSYDDLKTSIKKVIESKKLEFRLEANKELYQDAIRKETELYQKRNEAQTNLQKTQKSLSKKLEEYGLTIEDVENRTDKYASTVSKLNKGGFDKLLDITTEVTNYKASLDTLEGYNEEWNKNMETRAMYEQGYTALVTGDSEKIREAEQKIAAQYENGTQTIASQLSQRLEYATKQREKLEANGQQITNDQREQLRAQYENLTKTLIDETNRVGELTPEHAKAWKLLAEEDAELYNQSIQQVDEYTRLIIETSSNTVDMNSPEFAKKWSNLAQTSEEKFIKALSVLPEDTQAQILAMTIATTGMTPTVEKAYENLSLQGKRSFLAQLSGLPEDEKTKIQEAINGVYEKTGSMSQAGKDISDALTQSATRDKINLANKFYIDTNELKRKYQQALSTLGNDSWVIKGVLGLAGKAGISLNADGGFPDVGQMFIAREAGPELVGTIGNRTAVVNNQQIVEAVSQGVASAVSRVMGNQGGSYQLFIDGEQITNVVQQRINRNANIYGR